MDRPRSGSGRVTSSSTRAVPGLCSATRGRGARLPLPRRRRRRL